MNIPNMLTTARFFLIPVYIWVFFSPNIEKNLLLSTVVFIVAGITDLLDGHIARKYDMVTEWGTVLDPLADKLMQITVVVCLTIGGYIPVWLPAVVIAKEGLMIIGGLTLYFRGEKVVVPANRYGKLATVVFYLGIFLISLELGRGVNLFAVIAIIVFMTMAFLNYYKVFREIHREIK